MILIGEKLNSSIPSALEALQARDEQAVTELIRRQAQAGADYLDFARLFQSIEKGEAEALIARWVTGARTALSVVRPKEA